MKLTKSAVNADKYFSFVCGTLWLNAFDALVDMGLQVNFLDVVGRMFRLLDIPPFNAGLNTIRFKDIMRENYK